MGAACPFCRKHKDETLTWQSLQQGNTMSQESLEQDEGVLQHKQEMMQATVETWRKEQIYITKGVTATQEKILSQDCVCVVGGPGAGKSTAIQQAALSLENKGFIIYLLHGHEEFLKYFDKRKKQVFILDDVLGVYSLNQEGTKFWLRHNDKLRSIVDNNTKLLVSIRNGLYHQALNKDHVRDFVFLDKSTCVDLCDKTYRLDTPEMIGMLTHCLTVQGVDNVDDLVKQVWGYTVKELQDMTDKQRLLEMSKNTAGLYLTDCYPLLCKVFSRDEFARQNPQEFFRNPYQGLIQIFELIKSDNILQFCGLVLCTVFDGKLTEDWLSLDCERDTQLDETSLALRNSVMTSCDLEGQKHLPQIKSALNSLDGGYVTLIGNTYKMAHKIFHDVVTYLFHETDPSCVFDYGTREFILDRIRLVKIQQEDDPYMIIINDDKNIQQLADRMFRDFKYDTKTGCEIIICFPDIDDDRLISCLRRKLSDREQTDKKLIDQLFFQCMTIVWKKRDTYKHGDVTQFKLIELCVEMGVDCNMNIHGAFPLHFSVVTGSIQLTKLMLNNGADKRRIVWLGQTVLIWVLTDAKYNKLELIKLLTQHGVDQSVVCFVTNERHRILQEVVERYRDTLRLEEVLSDNSIKFLTNDKHKIIHHVKHYNGNLQLVIRLHDDILTYCNDCYTNLLYWSIDNLEITRYLLDFPQIKELVNKPDSELRTPYWYAVNKDVPVHVNLKVSEKDREEMMQLYKDNGAKLFI